jgi:hypothetical protein
MALLTTVAFKESTPSFGKEVVGDIAHRAAKRKNHPTQLRISSRLIVTLRAVP